MSNSDRTKIGLSHIKRNALLLVVAWSVIVFALLLWNALQTREETRKYAHIYTNAAFEKDILYRRCTTMHEGVYVPVTNKTPPNPYLSDIPERDITTPSGRQLTLMNPAYMTRQVYEFERAVSGARSHLTSSKPIKPENAPDKWEKKALVAFVQGAKEISSIENIEGREYFRLMRPLITETGCLKCHAGQGYKVNDIRGGISVSLPMDSIRELAGISQSRNIAIYLLLWLVGTGGIAFGYYLVSKSEFKRNQAEKEREIAYLDLEKKVHDRTADLNKVNEMLQESEERLRLSTELANVAVWEYSFITNSMSRSSNHDQLYGLEWQTKWDKSTFLKATHPDDREYSNEIIQKSVATGGPDQYTFDFRVVYPDQSIHWLMATGQVIERNSEGQGLIVRGCLIDITERKRAEEELRKYRDHLEELVKERTKELEEAQEALVSIVEDLNEKSVQLAQAMEQARSADHLKSAFLATMSHELRTPLNSIIGFTGIVLQGMSGPLNEEQAKQLTMVKNSANHLLDLINDVLDISKIEAGQVQITRKSFDMRSVIETALRTVSPLAAKKGLSLDSAIASDVGVIISDRRRVEQILINLVGNAVKFTKQGKIRVSAKRRIGVSATEEGAGGDFMEISVADTGIGIKPEDIDRIFKPFSQVETGMARSHEGTGLGLSICEKLAGMLGGTIRAESEWGKGSKITFTLPLGS